MSRSAGGDRSTASRRTPRIVRIQWSRAGSPSHPFSDCFGFGRCVTLTSSRMALTQAYDSALAPSSTRGRL